MIHPPATPRFTVLGYTRQNVIAFRLADGRLLAIGNQYLCQFFHLSRLVPDRQWWLDGYGTWRAARLALMRAADGKVFRGRIPRQPRPRGKIRRSGTRLSPHLTLERALFYERLGRRVRAAWKASGLTNGEISQRMNRTAVYVSAMANKRTGLGRVDALWEFAQALGLELSVEFRPRQPKPLEPSDRARTIGAGSPVPAAASPAGQAPAPRRPARPSAAPPPPAAQAGDTA